MSSSSVSTASTGEFVLQGYVLDAPEWGVLRGFENGAVAVADGKIFAVGHVADVRSKVPDWPETAWQSAPTGQRWLILPGLIDVHAHLPQYPVVSRVETDELLMRGR